MIFNFISRIRAPQPIIWAQICLSFCIIVVTLICMIYVYTWDMRTLSNHPINRFMKKGSMLFTVSLS